MDKPLIVDYYTDILCVWAWIAQRRIDELNSKLSDQIDVRYFYVDVFGDVAAKMNTLWKKKGGFEGFAAHVQEAASKFENAPVNPDIWTRVRPVTSANAHMVLKAVELAQGRDQSIAMALLIRRAFFTEARDVGSLPVLRKLLDDSGLERDSIEAKISDGSAMAALMQDYQRTKQQGIKGSPSYVMDGGRQILYGNVGYRVLQANIEQLLSSPRDEASWC